MTELTDLMEKARQAQQRAALDGKLKYPVQLEIGGIMSTCADTLERYQVFFSSEPGGSMWSAFYMAEDFAHAFEQASDPENIADAYGENTPTEISSDYEIVVIRKGDHIVSL